jgi:hypothetical protein
MSVKELFDFVIDPAISDESVDEYLEKVTLSLTHSHTHGFILTSATVQHYLFCCF